jgi:hypothetical protein
MTNCVHTVQWRKSVWSKHLTNESDIFVQASLLAIGNCNTRSLLSSMLQRKQPEE